VTDADCIRLLELLYAYVTDEDVIQGGGPENLPITRLADDLEGSLDRPNKRAMDIRDNIVRQFSWRQANG
jgi:hypothetical protein